MWRRVPPKTVNVVVLFMMPRLRAKSQQLAREANASYLWRGLAISKPYPNERVTLCFQIQLS